MQKETNLTRRKMNDKPPFLKPIGARLNIKKIYTNHKPM